MSISAEPASNRTGGQASVSHDDSDLVFRALVVGGRRRGVRLERIFWISLARAAEQRGVTVATLIAEAADSPNETNLASALRVKVARWLTDSLPRDTNAGTDLSQLVAACPSPAALVAGDGRLEDFNDAFGKLLQRATRRAELPRDLRIELDASSMAGAPVPANIVGDGATLARLEVRVAKPDGSGTGPRIAFALHG